MSPSQITARHASLLEPMSASAKRPCEKYDQHIGVAIEVTLWFSAYW